RAVRMHDGAIVIVVAEYVFDDLAERAGKESLRHAGQGSLDVDLFRRNSAIFINRHDKASPSACLRRNTHRACPYIDRCERSIRLLTPNYRRMRPAPHRHSHLIIPALRGRNSESSGMAMISMRPASSAST